MSITKIPILYTLCGLVAALVQSFVAIATDKTILISDVVLSLFLCLLICWYLCVVANTARHFMWARKGYNRMPIFIFPLLILFSDKIEIKVAIDPVLNGIVLPPNTNITCFEDEARIAPIIIRIEKNVFFVKMATILIIGVVSIILHWYCLSIACLASMGIFLINAYIDDNIWHGQLIIIEKIRNGDLFLYYMRYEFLYNEISKDMVKRFRKLIAATESEDKQDYFILLIWRFILASACAGNDILDSDDIEYIEKHLIRAFRVKRPFFSREQIQLIVLYMYYGIINDDVGKTNIAVAELTVFSTQLNSFSQKAIETFNYYANIGRNRIITERDCTGRKMPLIIKDYLYESFDNYRKTMESVDMAVRSHCESQRE